VTKPAECNVILKYCEIIDEFIKIRVFSDEDITEVLQVKSVPNKRAYQQLVVNACVQNYVQDVVPLFKKFNRVYKPEAIEELLYQLCVEVNPHLEIHQVSLPYSEGEAELDKLQFFTDPSVRNTKEFRQKIFDLEANLSRHIIGQEEAVGAVSRAVKKAAIGLKDPRKPIGVFLLVGATGTGKTELAKVVARQVFSSIGKMVRVDCSEYALPHEYAKLIGAPPGYIGHNEGGYLTEAMKEKKACVVLFDEIEKAHQKVHNLLLQLMDEGFLTDSKGTVVPFNKSIIFLTSNVGVEEIESIKNRMGFDYHRRQAPSKREARECITESMKATFRPEFINRLDDVIIFNNLNVKDCVQIARLQLKEVSSYLSNSATIQLAFSPRVEYFIARAGYSPEYGARELRRLIRQKIENPLSERIISGEFGTEDEVMVTIKRGRIALDCVSKGKMKARPTAQAT
jgi:ATP-dependent Clp protease ATP-binding subunit ClpC